MIEVRNVSKRFGQTVALDGVSMTVERGEILGFLGPNGAGKSTAMKIITSFLAPDDGTVVVDGMDVGEKVLMATIHSHHGSRAAGGPQMKPAFLRQSSVTGLAAGPRPCSNRATYLPIISVSMLSLSPDFRRSRFVARQVWGMMLT